MILRANQSESNAFSSTADNEIMFGEEVRSRTTEATKLVRESSLMKKSMHRSRQINDSYLKVRVQGQREVEMKRVS